MKLYQDREWLYQKYIVEELSIPQIALLCNCNNTTIWYWLHKLNIPIRSQSEARILQNGSKNANYHNAVWLKQKYIKEKLNTYQIAKLCKVNPTTICCSMRRLKIPIRSNSEAIFLIYKEENKGKLYTDKDWLYQKRWIEGLNTCQIAKLCNCGRRTIGDWLHRLNIPVRSQSEANHLSQGNHCNLSQKAIGWINGELLGDGCLQSRNPYSANFTYSSKYFEYAKYVSDALKSFGIKGGKIYKSHRTYIKIIDRKVDCYAYIYASKAYAELLPIYEQWYPEGKKIVPKDIKLSSLTCRQWYIGDGCLLLQKRAHPRIALCTCGFTIEDVEWLVKKLIELGFKATRQPCNNTIRISAHSTKAFLDYIGSCPVKCYQYKFDYEGCKLGLRKSFQPALAI